MELMAKAGAKTAVRRKSPDGASLRPAQVLAQIDEGRIEPLYILFGADTAAADDIIAALKARLLEPGFDAFDFESCHATDRDPALLLQQMNQPPMGSKRRLLVIRDLNRLDRKPAAELCAGLAKAPEFSCVAVTAGYDPTLKTLFARTGLTGRVVNLYEPYPDDLVRLLRRWAKERGVDLTEDAATLLRDIAGTETSLLRSEVEKVASAVGKNGRADADVVREVAANSREFSLREYVTRALGRDSRGALSVLRQLFDWGESPVRVQAWLSTGLLAMVGKSSETGKDWDPAFLNRALHRLYAVCRLTLTGYPEPELLLEQFTICLACRESDRGCRLHASATPPEFCLRRPLPGRKTKRWSRM